MQLLSRFRQFGARELVLAESLFAAAMLSAALVAQYGFRLYPCHLCMLQRYPYAAIVVIGLAAGFYIKSDKILRYALWLCVALLFLDAGIAAYHAGVEAGIFPAPSGCASNAKGGQTLEEMRAAIMNAPLVTCDQAMAHILGLSLAAWNAITATCAVIGTIILYRKIKP